MEKSLEIGKKLEVLTKFWDLWTNLKFKENGNLVKFWNLEKVLKFEKNRKFEKKISKFGNSEKNLGIWKKIWNLEENLEIWEKFGNRKFFGNSGKVWKWGEKLENIWE